MHYFLKLTHVLNGSISVLRIDADLNNLSGTPVDGVHYISAFSVIDIQDGEKKEIDKQYENMASFALYEKDGKIQLIHKDKIENLKAM